jgi:hypothetical protein
LNVVIRRPLGQRVFLSPDERHRPEPASLAGIAAKPTA